MTLSYTDLCRHLLQFDCPDFKTFNCPFGECDKHSASMTKVELEHHLLAECPHMIVQCLYCKTTVSRSAYSLKSEHDCREVMQTE